MRVETISEGSLVTVLDALDDERSLRLGILLDEACDAGRPAVLDLRAAGAPSFVAWLVIERCRSRFAKAGSTLRLITNGGGYTEERRGAQQWLTELRAGRDGSSGTQPG